MKSARQRIRNVLFATSAVFNPFETSHSGSVSFRKWLFVFLAWVTVFPVIGAAQTNHLDCYACHGADTLARHHATPQYEAGNCAYCHAGVVVTGDCGACHTSLGGLQNPHHQQPGSSNCATCHTGVGNLADCLGCHGGKTRTPHHATIQTQGRLCTECHAQLQATTGCKNCHSWITGINPHHASSWAVNGDCMYCHQMVWDPVLSAIVTKMRNCEDCHGTTGGTTAERHHATSQALKGQCTFCHVGAEASRINCAACHADPNKHHALVATMNFPCTHCHATIQLVTTGCASCHAGDIPGIHHATAPAVAGNCAACHQGVSNPRVCANCHADNPHHSTMWAMNGECTHCHARPSWAMDAPMQAACRQCHGPTKHDKGGPIKDFGACFACHNPTPYHAKPTVNPTWWETAPGKGSFNLFYSQFRRPEEFYENTPLEHFGENVIENIQGRNWRQPLIAFNWATIDHLGNLYQVPTFDGTLQPPPMDSTPIVKITYPDAGATVSRTITLAATASDPNGVKNVYAWVGGYQPVPMQGPNGANTGIWTAAWDTTRVADGLHMIYIQAVDKLGYVASRDLAVTVANGSGGGTPTDGTSLAMCLSCHGDFRSKVSCTNVKWQEHLTAGRVSVGTYELAETTYLGAICPRGGGTPGADLSVCTDCHGTRIESINCYDHEWRMHVEKNLITKETAQAAEMYQLGYICDWHSYSGSSVMASALDVICTSCHGERRSGVRCSDEEWREHLTKNLVPLTTYETAELTYLGYRCGGGYSYAGVISSGATGSETGGITTLGGSLASIADLTTCMQCHGNYSSKVGCRNKAWRMHFRKNLVGRTEFEAAEATYLGSPCNDNAPASTIPKDRTRKR